MMKHFKLYSNCLLVKGFKRSLIVDTQRIQYQLIPNDLFEILLKTEKISLDEIYIEYNVENKKIIENYFNRLIEEELGFYCNEEEVEWFPKMNIDFQTPFLIESCIVEELSEVVKYKNLILQLEDLQCQYIEIIMYKTLTNELLLDILSLFEKSSINRIGLILKFDEHKDLTFLKYLTTRFLRIVKIIIHSTEDDEVLNYNDFNATEIIKSSIIIDSFKFCGVVDMKYFTPHIAHFTESLQHNTCLNRKISIDRNGEIKNCPAISKSFGKLQDTSLATALADPEFKKYWNVNKDQINTCKDCEFRHICTDCRGYTEDENDQYAKPLKCGYNPYTNEWAEWSTNPLKEKAIEYYGMQDLVKKDV